MNRLLVGIMLLAIVCIAGSCTDEDEYTQGQWMKKASYNGVYRAYASGFTIGNYGYLCGGFYGANKDYLNDLWEYDMSRNSWTQCADMPVAGRKAAVGFAVNGKGYITTGSVKDGSSSYCVADTWEYDPATDTWTRKDDFKGGVRDGALAFSIGGYGYVGTGCNSVAGETTVPIWWISGSSTEATGPSCVTLPIRTPTMTMTMTTPSHGPKPYPSSSVEGDLWLREYVTALP